MEKNYILRNLPGKWLNKDCNLHVEIEKHTIEKFKAKYNPSLQLENDIINEDIIDTMQFTK